jgi:hypothetical protein
VLQPLSEPAGNQVEIMVQSDAAGTRPVTGYTVVAWTASL